MLSQQRSDCKNGAKCSKLQRHTGKKLQLIEIELLIYLNLLRVLTQDVQFKLHDKFVTFRKCGDLRSNVKLLAVSSSRDLLFAGNPTAPELKGLFVICK